MRRAGGDARGAARGTVRRARDVEHASEDVATRERAVALGAVALGAVAMTLGSGVADAGDVMTAFARRLCRHVSVHRMQSISPQNESGFAEKNATPGV